MIPCVRIVEGKQRTCLCSAEVKAEIALETELGQARVPDSARESA
jgi:hypothetical protein